MASNRIKKRDSTVRNSSGVMRDNAEPNLLRVLSDTSTGGEPRFGLDIHHGLQPDYTLRVGGRISTVMYSPNTQDCLIYHSKGVDNFTQSEHKESFRLSDEWSSDSKHMLYAVQFEVYVSIGKHQLSLLDKSFRVLSTVDSAQKVSAAVFNFFSEEVITAGPGYISVSC